MGTVWFVGFTNAQSGCWPPARLWTGRSWGELHPVAFGLGYCRKFCIWALCLRFSDLVPWAHHNHCLTQSCCCNNNWKMKIILLWATCNLSRGGSQSGLLFGFGFCRNLPIGLFPLLNIPQLGMLSELCFLLLATLVTHKQTISSSGRLEYLV